MSAITGASPAELEVSDYILNDALKSHDPHIKAAADEVVRNRETLMARSPQPAAVH
jgi:hypothetical protein